MIVGSVAGLAGNIFTKAGNWDRKELFYRGYERSLQFESRGGL